MCAWGARRGPCVNRRRFSAPIGENSSDGFEERPAMTNGADADFLQVLRREAWQDLFGNLVFAECGLVLPKTEAPQPDHNVHDGRPQSVVACIICRRGESVQGGGQVFKAFASLLG